jgi:voltage-gated potassium channel
VIPPRRLINAAGLLGVLILLGTLGYMQIGGMSAVDALYMTVITISTVGYREVAPLGVAGQLFTIMLIVTGVGSFFYLFTVIAGLVVESR